MSLGRREARHQTVAQIKAAGSDPSAYWDFKPGQSVQTVDGFPGVVSAVHDGPVMGVEAYDVTLDNGMGGGTYSSSQLSPVEGTTAAVEHTAADDYPELEEILHQRPDIARNTVLGSLSVVAEHQHDGPYEGTRIRGSKVEDLHRCVECGKQYVDQAFDDHEASLKTAINDAEMSQASSERAQYSPVGECQHCGLGPFDKNGYCENCGTHEDEDEPERSDPRDDYYEQGGGSEDNYGDPYGRMDAYHDMKNSSLKTASEDELECSICGRNDVVTPEGYDPRCSRHVNTNPVPDDNDSICLCDAYAPGKRPGKCPIHSKTAAKDDDVDLGLGDGDDGFGPDYYCTTCHDWHGADRHTGSAVKDSPAKDYDGVDTSVGGATLQSGMSSSSDSGSNSVTSVRKQAADSIACKQCAMHGIMNCRESVGDCDLCGKRKDVFMDYSKSGDRDKPDETVCLDCLMDGKHMQSAHNTAQASLQVQAEWSSQEPHSEPIIHPAGTRPPRPLQTGDTVVFSSGNARKVLRHSDSLLGLEGGYGPMHRAPIEGDHSNTIFGETADDRADMEQKLDVGSPEAKKFLETNPTGPTKYSARAGVYEINEECTRGGSGQCDGTACECPCHDDWEGGPGNTVPEVKAWHDKMYADQDAYDPAYAGEKHPFGGYETQITKNESLDITDPFDLLVTASSDPDFRFEVTAAWSDVRAKAKRIRAEGGVNVTMATGGMIFAEVRGDHNVYESALQKLPGKHAASQWSCGCKWGAYHWGADDDFSRFAGRMCSHALALQFEAQSRGMFGKSVQPDVEKPSWVPRRVVVKYDIDADKNLRAPATYPEYGRFASLRVHGSALSVLAAYANDEGLSREDFVVECVKAGITASVNSPWGEPEADLAEVPKTTGPTRPPHQTDNPASMGWASQADPDNWGGIQTPDYLATASSLKCSRTKADYAASEADDTCKECGHLVRDHDGEYSGGDYGESNTYQASLEDEFLFEADLEDKEAAAAAGEVLLPLLRSVGPQVVKKVAPQVATHELLKPHGEPEEPAAPTAAPAPAAAPPDPGAAARARSQQARLPTQAAMDESMLHDEPEPALPTTDGEMGWGNGSPNSGAMGTGSPNIKSDPTSLEPEDQSIMSTGGLDEVLGSFQQNAAYLNPQGDGGTDSSDIAEAARAHLAKEAVKDFTPGEQAQIINEGEHVTASNLDLLDIAGTHYEPLEAALAARDDEEDDDGWMS